MNDAPNNQLSTKVVLFDGICVLCSYWARFIIKYDAQRKFTLATVQSSLGQEILTYYGMSTTTFDTLLYVEGLEFESLALGGVAIKRSDKESKGLFIKTAAIFRVVSQLGGAWRLVALFNVIPSALSNSVYDLIARNRYTLFGKKKSCTLPTADHSSRYFSDRDNP